MAEAMAGPDEALADCTLDAFHRGRFFLVQPAGRGHRAGLDAMLLAAAVPAGFSGKVADLGAGAGAAGLAVASRCPAAEITLVEKDPTMAEFARRSLALAENAALARRCSLLQADVLQAGRARAAVGLPDNQFDFVIMNPPFNAAGGRASPDPLKRAAHVMPAGEIGAWIRTAAAIVRPGGRLALIVRPAMLPELLDGMGGRFGAIMVQPVHSRLGLPAIRILLRGCSGSRQPMALLPALVLHEATGNGFTPAANALINGQAALFEE